MRYAVLAFLLSLTLSVTAALSGTLNEAPREPLKAETHRAAAQLNKVLSLLFELLRELETTGPSPAIDKRKSQISEDLGVLLRMYRELDESVPSTPIQIKPTDRFQKRMYHWLQAQSALSGVPIRTERDLIGIALRQVEALVTSFNETTFRGTAEQVFNRVRRGLLFQTIRVQQMGLAVSEVWAAAEPPSPENPGR